MTAYDWNNATDADYAQVERIAAMAREAHRRGLPTTYVDVETFDLDREQAAQLEQVLADRLTPAVVQVLDQDLAEKAVEVAKMRDALAGRSNRQVTEDVNRPSSVTVTPTSPLVRASQAAPKPVRLRGFRR